MNSRKYLIYIIVAAILISSLCACGSDVPPPNDGAISFTDALGRSVTVEKKPSRVAALIGSFADVWVLSGGTLCAAAEDAFEDFGLGREGVVNLGGAHSPSLELLIQSDPDLVIASASTASNVALMEPLDSMGITVAYFDVDNFEDYLLMLGICTDITERGDLYLRHGKDLEARIEEIKEKYRSADVKEKERRVLLLRVSSTSVKAKGSKGTILGEMLSDIGCTNVADNDVSLLDNLSLEAIIREDPRHIFIVPMGGGTEEAKIAFEKMIKENPAWSTLEAVKSERVHFMDKKLFNMKPNSKFAEAYEILYENLTEE